MCRNRLAVALVGGILSTTPLAAQASPASAQRTEIQQVIKTYIDAHNRSDAATIAEMYSKQPGVTSVGDGQIMRGWDRIREAFDQLVGTEGKFKISTGSVDILPLGPGYALALTSYTLTLGSGAQETQQRGAMTLVLQKVQGEWKIIHDHTSTQAQAGGTAAPPSPPNQATANQSPAITQVQASAPAAPTVSRISITDGQAILVKAQGSAHYTFHLPPGVCPISGRITGIAGGNKDFEAFIMDDDNFQNYSAGAAGTRVLWQSGRVVVATIDATLTGPGTYHLVVSNSWSIATDKTVQAQASAQCGS